MPRLFRRSYVRTLAFKPEADREQRGGDDSNQSGFFDHIVIRKNKEKYTINASLRGVRLREKRIQHEDFLAYSFGLVSKEELADKYFQEEIKHSKDESKSIL